MASQRPPASRSAARGDRRRPIHAPRRPPSTGLAVLVLWLALGLSACGGTAATPTSAASASATATAGGSTVTAGGGAAQGGGGGGGGGSGGGGSTAASNPPSQPASPSPTPAESPSPGPPGGPYAVRQTQTLGGEVVTGTVCSPARPFSVTFATPKVTFTAGYRPRNGSRGTLAYAYTLSSAGESHEATGTYTITGPAGDGVLHLRESVRDHVVFKGFNGVVPLRYAFDLVPAAVVGCPTG